MNSGGGAAMAAILPYDFYLPKLDQLPQRVAINIGGSWRHIAGYGEHFTKGHSVRVRVDQMRNLFHQCRNTFLFGVIVETEKVALPGEIRIIARNITKRTEHFQACTAIVDEIGIFQPVNSGHDIPRRAF